MARLKNITPVQMGRLAGVFAGVLDFYYWKGQPCVRRWGFRTGCGLGGIARGTAPAFGAIARQKTTFSGVLREFGTRMLRHTTWTWGDFYTSNALAFWRETGLLPPPVTEVTARRGSVRVILRSMTRFGRNLWAQAITHPWASGTIYKEYRGIKVPCIKPVWAAQSPRAYFASITGVEHSGLWMTHDAWVRAWWLGSCADPVVCQREVMSNWMIPELWSHPTGDYLVVQQAWWEGPGRWFEMRCARSEIIWGFRHVPLEERLRMQRLDLQFWFEARRHTPFPFPLEMRVVVEGLPPRIFTYPPGAGWPMSFDLPPGFMRDGNVRVWIEPLDLHRVWPVLLSPPPHVFHFGLTLLVRGAFAIVPSDEPPMEAVIAAPGARTEAYLVGIDSPTRSYPLFFVPPP